MLDGTTESPPEKPQKTIRTLLSLQECEIAWGNPNLLEIKPDSPALVPEQFRVPNQTRKEPQCASWNTRESPRPLSQDERNTAVTSAI